MNLENRMESVQEDFKAALAAYRTSVEQVETKF